MYLKVIAEDRTSKIYKLTITKAKTPVAATKVENKTQIKLGLIGSKVYAEKVAKVFEQDYKCSNVTVKVEGKYYRVFLYYTDKEAARYACKDMVKRKYIINYYFVK